MGLHFIEGHEAGRDNDVVVMFCSTTGIAFGPTIDPSEDGERDAHTEAEAFLVWCDTNANWESGPRPEHRDLRSLKVDYIMELWAQYRSETE